MAVPSCFIALARSSVHRDCNVVTGSCYLEYNQNCRLVARGSLLQNISDCWCSGRTRYVRPDRQETVYCRVSRTVDALDGHVMFGQTDKSQFTAEYLGLLMLWTDTLCSARQTRVSLLQSTSDCWCSGRTRYVRPDRQESVYCSVSRTVDALDGHVMFGQTDNVRVTSQWGAFA